MPDDGRPEPYAFLDTVAKSRKGNLKVFVGAAAGVGKTYRMLLEAHKLCSEGRDVAIGAIETHGRAETAALLAGLEVIAPRKIPYHGIILEEMDLDAILARKPEIAVVDELAHTNAPDSRHRKRHQDVEALIDAGIGVIGAFNIQHLESLNDMVKRITGVEVRETIPDAFLAFASQVVTVDISVEELRQRLREGKIHPPERIEQALRNFFRSSNLAALRELALREVARDQSRQRENLDLLKREGGWRPAITDRVMACLSSNPSGADDLLRKAARTARQLNCEWYAAHVEIPSESMRKISTRDFRALLDNINLAGDLGAEVAWLKGSNVVKTLLDFAHEKRVSRIVIGRTRGGFLAQLVRGSVTGRLIAEARGFDLEIAAAPLENAS